MARESALRTIFIALAVCAVCSIMVSTAAVKLKGRQERNKLFDKRKNILIAAGLIAGGETVNEEKVSTLFKKVKIRLIDLEKGEETDLPAASSYNQRRAFQDPELSYNLSPEDDPAGLARMVKYGLVYQVYKDGQLDLMVFPVNGKGLWSTLYGFLALDKDLNTVRGITFYDHNETPGLGGEIENQKWQQSWQGRKIYKNNRPALRVIKGNAGLPGQDPYKIDGLSGATLTSKGVTKLIRFWFSQSAYGVYIHNLKQSLQSAAGAGLGGE